LQNVERIMHSGGNQLSNDNAGFESNNFNNWGGSQTGWTVTADQAADGGTYSAQLDNTNPSRGTLQRNDGLILAPWGGGYNIKFEMRGNAAYDGNMIITAFLHGQITAATKTLTVEDQWVNQNLGVDALLSVNPVHAGENMILTLTPGGGTAGTVWIDNLQLRQLGHPCRIWIPERYRGYVFEDDSQTLTVQIDVYSSIFTEDIADLEVYLELLDFDNQSTVFATATVGPLSDGGQTTTFDLSGIAMDTNLLLTNIIRVASSGVVATYTSGEDVTWANSKIIKARKSVRDNWASYIDFKTGASVWRYKNGSHVKRIPWGVYSRLATAFTDGTVPATSPTNYDQLRGMPKYPTQEGDGVRRLWPSLREGYVNLWHDYVNMPTADPRSGTDQLTPAIDSLMGHDPVLGQGIFYSQHMREWFWTRPLGGWALNEASTDGPNLVTITDGVTVVSTAHGLTAPSEGPRDNAPVNDGSVVRVN
ncbi:hypothetical protein LCGC14_2564710, partial [marine sediment metagenome]